jgi:hypothetical protein
VACQVLPLNRLGEGAQALDTPVDKFQDWQEITNSISPMKNSEQLVIPFKVVDSKLAVDDDRAFWHAALSVLIDEFLVRYAAKSTNKDWAIVFDACSHWVRPHQPAGRLPVASRTPADTRNRCRN